MFCFAMDKILADHSKSQRNKMRSHNRISCSKMIDSSLEVLKLRKLIDNNEGPACLIIIRLRRWYSALSLPFTTVLSSPSLSTLHRGVRPRTLRLPRHLPMRARLGGLGLLQRWVVPHTPHKQSDGRCPDTQHHTAQTLHKCLMQCLYTRHFKYLAACSFFSLRLHSSRRSPC